jgi:serine/threonine-protein kinase RsbW
MAHARRFPARMDAFPDIAAFVEAVCRDAGVGTADVLRVRLVLEELFTNTVSHGHGGDSDEPVDVAVDVTLTPRRIALTYEDGAPAFDPRTPPPPPGGTAEERPVGHLGLVLVRAMARDVAYDRVEGRNRVRLWLGVGPTTEA